MSVYSDPILSPAGKEEKRIGAGVGGSGLNSFNAFVGPKDSDILRSVNPKLDQLIDWGTWFGFIAKPLFFVLTWTAKHVTGNNFGWAIVLVTIAINMVLFPAAFFEHAVGQENAGPAAADRTRSTPSTRTCRCAIPASRNSRRK